jgi:hypothetical protein
VKVPEARPAAAEKKREIAIHLLTENALEITSSTI